MGKGSNTGKKPGRSHRTVIVGGGSGRGEESSSAAVRREMLPFVTEANSQATNLRDYIRPYLSSWGELTYEQQNSMVIDIEATVDILRSTLDELSTTEGLTENDVRSGRNALRSLQRAWDGRSKTSADAEPESFTDELQTRAKTIFQQLQQALLDVQAINQEQEEYEEGA